MGIKTPPFPPYPAWSTAKFFGFLRSALRTASTRWPPKYEVKAEAKRPYKGPDKRRKFEYKCAQCGLYHADKDVEVDHVVPVGSLRTFDDLPGFVERLFCPKEGLRLLCKPCHLQKTAEEKGEQLERV